MRVCEWNKLDEGLRDGTEEKKTKHKVHCTTGELDWHAHIRGIQWGFTAKFIFD